MYPLFLEKQCRLYPPISLWLSTIYDLSINAIMFDVNAMTKSWSTLRKHKWNRSTNYHIYRIVLFRVSTRWGEFCAHFRRLAIHVDTLLRADRICGVSYSSQCLRNSSHFNHLKISPKYDFLDDWRPPSMSSSIRIQCQRMSKAWCSKSQNSNMNWLKYLWIDAIKFRFQSFEWRSAFMLSELGLRQMFACLQHSTIESYRAWSMHRFIQTPVPMPWRLSLFWSECLCMHQSEMGYIWVSEEQLHVCVYRCCARKC